jgi:hypothetical protein
VTLRVLYHDVDRLPYLLAVRDCARRHGVELVLLEHQRRGSEDWAEVLRRGEVELIGESYWRLQRYRAAGVPFVTLASAVHLWTELLLVRDGIRTLEDLRGRRLAVRGTGPQALYPSVFLREAGLQNDVETVRFSEKDTGRWGHWQRVLDGTCDACFVLPLYSDAPKAAGLREIAYPSYAFDGAHVTLTTTEAILARERDALAHVVDAMFQATELVRSDPARIEHLVRTECRDALAEHFDLSTAERVARVSELLSAEVWEPPIPTLAGIENALTVAREAYPELDGYNPLVMWDLAFAREVSRS